MTIQTLVTIENDTPLADSRAIAETLGVDHESFFRLITDYQEEIEKDFGSLRFEIGVKSGPQRGKLPKYALLNENQTYTLMMYTQNTEQARNCKRMLVKAFSEARQGLADIIAATNERMARLETRMDALISQSHKFTFHDGDHACVAVNIYHLSQYIGRLNKMLETPPIQKSALQSTLQAILRKMNQLETAATHDAELDEQLIELHGIFLSGGDTKKLLS